MATGTCGHGNWAGANRPVPTTPVTDIMTNQKTCRFCDLSGERIIAEDPHCTVILDGYPVSPGHALVIPKRHTPSFFETTAEERQALFAALDVAKSIIDQEFAPAAYNIGVNDGAAAGQSVPHLHIHLIPRYPGDKPDPRGGVRWILPDTAKYW